MIPPRAKLSVNDSKLKFPRAAAYSVLHEVAKSTYEGPDSLNNDVKTAAEHMRRQKNSIRNVMICYIIRNIILKNGPRSLEVIKTDINLIHMITIYKECNPALNIVGSIHSRAFPSPMYSSCNSIISSSITQNIKMSNFLQLSNSNPL
jgi:hypothetical protein